MRHPIRDRTYARPRTGRDARSGAPFSIGVADEPSEALYDQLVGEVLGADRSENRFAGTVVLVARTRSDASDILGGISVRPHGAADDGWWRAEHLVAAQGAPVGVGSALVRAATTVVESAGAVRFDACIAEVRLPFARRIGWVVAAHPPDDGGCVHVHRPLRTTRLHESGHRVEVGPGSLGENLFAAVGFGAPAAVWRDPWWAGWSAVVDGAGRLAASGAEPVGVLGIIDATHPAAAAASWGISRPDIHVRDEGASAVAVSVLGRATRPVPTGPLVPGWTLSLLADVSGQWRSGRSEPVWDSLSGRTPDEVAALHAAVATAGPDAALWIGSTGLLDRVATAAGAADVGVTLDVERIPRPEAARLDRWLRGDPGFAILLAHGEDLRPVELPGATRLVPIGSVEDAPGVRLLWPDGLTLPLG